MHPARPALLVLAGLIVYGIIMGYAIMGGV